MGRVSRRITKSTGDAVGALLSADVPAVFVSMALALPNVKAGKMRALAVSGSADFQLIVSDTMAVLDARYTLALDSGERIFVQNHALRRGSAEAIAKLVKGEPVDPAEIYFRCVPTFEVSDPSLKWLTESIFIGTGARFPDRVEIVFYRVA